MIDRRTLVMGSLATGLAAGAGARAQTPPPAAKARPAGLPEPRETIDLWPAGAPGMPSAPPIETVDERSKEAALTDRAVSMASPARGWSCSGPPFPTARRCS